MRNVIVAVFVIIFVSTGFSQYSLKYHPFSGTIGITGELGGTLALSDFNNNKIDFLGKANVEYFFPTTNMGIFGLRIFGGGGYIAGKGGATSNYPLITEFRTDLLFVGAGLSYNLQADESIYPYVFAGISYLYFNPKDQNGDKMPFNSINKYSRNEKLIIGETGVRFKISDEASINFALGLNYAGNDNLDDLDNSLTNGTDDDVFFTGLLGFTLFLGGTSDSDADGIEDELDLCPHTPEGIQVDQFGCPVDVDKDGVPDYMDLCQGSPLNVPVDENGCPLDTDSDGIPDYLDLCRDTPLKVKVDKRGCPIDTDGDGVPDYKDKCANTAAGVEVDKNGCELVSEISEIPTLPTKVILSGATNFESGNSVLPLTSLQELDKLLPIMKEFLETRWRIEGYTDSKGSAKLNKKLSLERANSIKNYFVNHGIDESRFETFGFGSDFPVGDNSTESGRAMNRRVTIEMIGADDIQNYKISDDYSYNPANEKNVGEMIFTDGYLYCYQVSSWRTRSKAEAEKNRLIGKGLKAFITEARLPELEGIWYRVRVGFFRSYEEALQSRIK